MKFINYYKLLNPEDKTRILVTGKEAIPLSLFLTGKAKEENKLIEATAIISEENEIQNIREEIYLVKEKYPELKKTIEKGISKTNFERTNFKDFESKLKYDYFIFYKDNLTEEDLKKTIQLKIKKQLLNLPISYSMLIENNKKSLFFKKEELKSLKQLLEEAGAKISFYEADEKRLIILLEGLKKSFKTKQADIEKTSERIIKELEKYLKYIKGGANFAVKSEDGEYLYYIKIEDKKTSAFEYNFIFLNGVINKKKGEVKTRSKKYKIIVIPNTPVFRKELEKKEVIITTKEKAVQIFQENYAPI